MFRCMRATVAYIETINFIILERGVKLNIILFSFAMGTFVSMFNNSGNVFLSKIILIGVMMPEPPICGTLYSLLSWWKCWAEGS